MALCVTLYNQLCEAESFKSYYG